MSKTVMTLEELRDAAVVYKGLLDQGYDVENINLDAEEVEFEYLSNGFLVSTTINSDQIFIEHIF